MGVDLSVTINTSVFGRLDREVSARAKAASQRVFNSVVERSPVRTGSFRASWRVSKNVIDESVTNGGAPEAPLPPPSFPHLELRVGDQVYISNNQPYALKLEYGWSQQAPMGILRAAMASLQGKL